MSAAIKIDGILSTPKLGANGALYRGRFTCPSVQWTKDDSDTLATFSITAGELADAAASGILWTDQDVQRGIQPGVQPPPPRELSLANGYPDTTKYIFDSDNANDIVEKLLRGEQLFLNPLIWNLRPSNFEAYYNEDSSDLYIYSGRIYLPDSHHRQQAIVKAVDIWRGSKKDYPRFSDSREFKIELYFLSREDEGNYFFDKNQRTKPTAKSKAYDLTTHDDLSLLAKKVIENSPNLSGNVNRVTDRLVAKNPQVMTLSTLREMMKTFAAEQTLEGPELDGLALVAAEFYDLLASVRPELGQLAAPERAACRRSSLADAAVMMHGYASIMKEYNADLANLGQSRARETWKSKLRRLSAENRYNFRGWIGDFFDKRNPLWVAVGVEKLNRDQTKYTVLNTGAARSECGRILRLLMALPNDPDDLEILARR